MSNTPQPKRGIVTRHTHPQRSLIKRIYVAALLILLPLLMTLFSTLSKRARSETLYLGKGFTLKIAIAGWSRSKTARCSTKAWRSNQKAIPTLTIEFRDLDYAYEVFCGSITLQDALAARYFTTHGPNDKGVAVTYLFTVILKTFFGWRKSYRR